jgi:hypothetical protein
MAVRFRNLANLNLGQLNNLKDKHLVKYNANSTNFELFSVNELLDTSTTDNNVSDSFVEQLEREIDASSVTIENVDGGSF